MSLIVETGQGLPNAESYISVADADARHASLGNTGWTGTEATKEALLRRATAYMEQAYRLRWKGTRVYRVQALSWPRYGAVVDGYDLESTTVPTEVANACADLAMKAAAGDLAPDLERGLIRKKIGPIEKEWDRNSPQATRYRNVDMALAPYLKGSSSMATLVRC